MSSEKKIDGKAFVADLKKCEKEDDIFTLLQKTMSHETLCDRVSHMPDNELVVNLHAQRAEFNTLRGYRTSHEDCVLMAAGHYMKMTEKSIRSFKGRIDPSLAPKVRSVSGKGTIGKKQFTVNNPKVNPKTTMIERRKAALLDL